MAGHGRPEYPGSIYQDDFFEIINSQEARAFREQVHTGKYDLCRTEQCLPDFEPVTSQILDSIAASDYEIDHPRYYALNYDPTCNLVCPSCRPTKLTLHRNQRATVLEFQERLFESGALENATIHLTQEGDPFASQVYWRLLKKLNNERPVGIQLILQTNGLGLTPKVVRELENLHSAIGTISVSIDAATASTYAVVRGGNFELLLENLDNLHRVFVLPGKAKLILNFVLQTANYQDVPQFLDLARRLGASCFIGMIGNKCIPAILFESMQNLPRIELIVNEKERNNRLVEEYGALDKTLLQEATLRLRKRLGDEQTRLAVQLLNENKLNEWVAILLTYYDKTYIHSRNKTKKTIHLLNYSWQTESASFSQLLLLIEKLINERSKKINTIQ